MLMRPCLKRDLTSSHPLPTCCLQAKPKPVSDLAPGEPIWISHGLFGGIFKSNSSELGGCLKYLFCGAPGALGCCDGYCCQDAFCVPC